MDGRQKVLVWALTIDRRKLTSADEKRLVEGTEKVADRQE